MSSTVHLQIYDAAVAALNAAPALADGNVRSMRQSNRRMPEGVGQQLRVYLEQTVPSSVVGGSAPVDWVTRLRIECVARDTTGPAAAYAFDVATQLAAAAQQRLLEDQALNALAIEITPGPMAWDEDEADSAMVACQVRINIVHRSAYSNFSA